jgi:hypothetical protein
MMSQGHFDLVKGPREADLAEILEEANDRKGVSMVRCPITKEECWSEGCAWWAELEKKCSVLVLVESMEAVHDIQGSVAQIETDVGCMQSS